MTASSLCLPARTSWVDRAAFPFRTRRVAVTGGSLSVVDHGEGEPVLFAHGTPTWSFEWRHLISDLSRDHRCIAPDHLGFGLSDRPRDQAYAPEDHARRLRELVDRLDLRDFTLVVHDFGGPIALPLALDGLARRVVVINSFGWPPDDDPGIRRAATLLGGRLGRALYRWANLSPRVILPAAFADRRRLPPEVHAQYLRPFRDDRDARVRVLHALARALRSSRPYFEELWSRRAALRELPALVLWGARDPAFPLHLLDRWREALPRAQVVELEDSGHWPHEEEPETVLAALRAFLDRETWSAHVLR